MKSIKKYWLPFLSISLFILLNWSGFLFQNEIDLNKPYYYPIGILCTFAISALLIFTYQKFKKSINKKNLFLSTEKLSFTFNKKRDLRLYFIVFGILIISWLFVLLIFFPGIFAYDANKQLLFANSQLRADAPIVQTLLLKLFVNIIGDGLGSSNTGLMLYCIFQVIGFASLLSFVVVFLQRINVKKVIKIVFVVFFCIYPVFGILAVSTNYDVFFSGFFVNLFLSLIYLVKCDKQKLSLDIKIIIPVSVIGTALFRHNGLLVVFVYAVLFLIFYPKKTKYTILKVGGLVVLCFSLNFVIKTTTSAVSGGLLAPFCVPCQQLAWVYNNHYDSFTDEEKDIMNNLIPEPSSYNPIRADKIVMKAQEAQSGNKANFPYKDVALMYLKCFFRYPADYVHAFFDLIRGQYYLFDNSYQFTYSPGKAQGYLWIQSADNNWGIEDNSLLPELNNIYQYLFHDNNYLNCPFMTVILSIAIWNWILFFCFIFSIYKRDNMLLVLLLPMLLIGTFLMGPCILVRYALPIFIISPVSLIVTRRL